MLLYLLKEMCLVFVSVWYCSKRNVKLEVVIVISSLYLTCNSLLQNLIWK